MAAHKGHKKVGGRQKGTPNKTTASIKRALTEAFDELGGVEALVKWGKKNPTEFYKLWSKLLPVELKTADGESLRVQVVEEIVDADSQADGQAPRGPAPLPA